ncbi:MAG: 50S ribosomal protein L25/general stress protein Ctc [Sneathiella sp.]|jgi:large subunit ribosomal protein L25|uniref:50S ribosomal protein L25/general stress protein Ctc n=1 Tax=Sneathiella sp. TaxID=1964365 RepID=UPI000C535E52|nr:50S ribosomal protein L25/general stress protein Ctc [Sneathiella sp.]MAL80360.1 50S ribosomal protein L25/general stress protein Ctc [Sneathiella sp.]|tara:strand:- start:198 stop:851 length:654 start_codon:yes stop_codon:yes gene_type:complete
MSDNAVLLAETRDRVGKGTSRALRREGRLPAVIYGDKKEPVSISLATKDVVKAINRDSFLATVYTVEVGSTKYNVLPRDLQLHPVSDTPIHIDFLRVSAKSQIAVMVPVHFLNDEDCVGVRRGGVLNVVRHEVELLVPAGNIPESIEIDLLNYDIGDSVHISDVSLPKGAQPTITDRDFTIATIAAPSGGVSDDEEEEGDDSETETVSAADEDKDED